MSADRMATARLLSRVNDRPVVGQDRTPRQPLNGDNMVARIRTSVVTQNLSKAPQANVKSKQAWKYPGGNIVRAPGVDINGRYYTDPKEDPENRIDSSTQAQPMSDVSNVDGGVPRRKQESNFFITLNNNREYGEDLEERARERFVKALEHLEDNDVLARCIKFGPKHDHYANDKAHDVILPGIDWKATVEVGENLNRMHAHIICYIQHYSQIQINPKMMQREFRMAFNGGLSFGDPIYQKDLPYIQVKMLPQTDWTTIMRQYIRKGMDGA